MVIVRNSRRWVHYAGRAAEMSTTAHPPSRSPPPRRPRAARSPRAVRRRRFLVAVADHSLLIAAAIAFVVAVRVHGC